MISRRTCVVSLAVGTLLATGLSVSAKSRHINLIRQLDSKQDKKLTLLEELGIALKRKALARQ